MKRVLFLVFGIILIATAGFKILGGEEWSFLDALYMVVITLYTVGFQEVHPLTEAQRVWTIITIFFGIGIIFYAISQATQFLLNFNMLRRRRMEERALKLKKHFIISGYGRMGKAICEEIHNQALPFVVVDSNDEKVATLSEKGYIYVQGDATDDDTLERANIKEASGLVVVLSSDTDNLFVTMSARTVNPDLFIISRCSVDENVPKLLRAGANKVVNPYIAGGHKMAELAVAPYVEDSVEISTPGRSIDLLIEEIKVKNADSCRGKAIRESRLREDYSILIAGVIDEEGQMVFNPGPDTMLQETDTLMLLGEKENLAKFKDVNCKTEDGS